jgi:hypothetical protein
MKLKARPQAQTFKVCILPKQKPIQLYCVLVLDKTEAAPRKALLAPLPSSTTAITEVRSSPEPIKSHRPFTAPSNLSECPTLQLDVHHSTAVRHRAWLKCRRPCSPPSTTLASRIAPH